MVVIPSTPAKRFSSHAASVITTIATSEPGIFLLTNGVAIISASDRIPIPNAHQFTSCQCSA